MNYEFTVSLSQSQSSHFSHLWDLCTNKIDNVGPGPGWLQHCYRYDTYIIHWINSPRLIARLDIYMIYAIIFPSWLQWGCKTEPLVCYLQGCLSECRTTVISPRLVARLDILEQFSKVGCKNVQFVWYLQGWVSEWRTTVISPRLVGRLETLEANSKLTIIESNFGDFWQKALKRLPILT